MTNIKVFYNDDDCRRFTLERCTSAMLWQQLASLFNLNMRTFFDEHRMTITHGGAGVKSIAIPSLDELSTILDILNNEDLGNKPVVLRIVKNESEPVAGKPDKEANAQVKAALNDAHVAALAQLDQAKTNVQAVKVANRQSLQEARDQAHQRLKAALDAVTSAKNMTSKTSTALKAMGIKPTRGSGKAAREGETEQEIDLFTVGNVIQLTPAGMKGQLRITPDGRMDANGGNGGLTRFQVMARRGDLIKLARNGKWLRLRGNGADGQGCDAQVPWIQLLAHSDGSVSLVSRNAPTLGLTVAPGGRVLVKSLQETEGVETEGVSKFTVAIADAQGQHAQAPRGSQRLSSQRHGHGRGRKLRHLLAEMPSLEQELQHDKPQEQPQEPAGPTREGHQDRRGHCRREGFGSFGGFGSRRCGGKAVTLSTSEMRLEALGRQIYKMKARRTFHEAHGATTEEEVTIRNSHLAHMSERIAMLEQAREQTLKTMEERAAVAAVAAGTRAAKPVVVAMPVMAEALKPTLLAATQESTEETDDVQDSDTSEDWVEVSLGSQILEVGDQVMLKSLVTGQLVGIDSVNREVVMLQDADDASGLMQVVASRVEGALKLRAVVNPKAFLRLGPKADGLDMKGLGGVWTDFVAQLDSDGTVSLMSARRPNHYAGCVDDALKAVLVAEGEVLPPCTKFVARKVEA